MSYLPRLFLLLLGAGIFCGCGGSSQSANSAIQVVMIDPEDDSRTRLSAKQAQWFLQDISGPGIESMISKYPAAPVAIFEYAGKEYLMHGNAVIHVDATGRELLWTGPYLQTLISNGPWIKESIAKAEELDSIAVKQMDPPGAYPGGGPAPLAPPKK